jgi:hypothetical protein
VRGVALGMMGARRTRYEDLPPNLRARCDASHGVPGSLAAIGRAVEERKIERCRCHVRALCRRVGRDDGTEARELLQTIVQFGGADVLLSTLSLLPDADPPAAVLALLNDSMYIRASSEPASPFPLTHHSASGLLKQQVSPAHTRCPRH